MFASHLFSLIVAAAVLLPLSSAAPLQEFEKRATAKKCGDGKPGPCVCNDALGLRLKNLNCPGTTFTFADPNSGTDGKMKKVSSSLGVSSQCDHIVELQFIADQINANPAICTKFTTPGNTDFQDFFNTINKSPNLVNVEATVNNAKGVMFSGSNFGTGTTKKAATGLASYLTLIKSDAQSVATTINAKMDSIMGAGQGFSNFASSYVSEINSIITKANSQAKNLAAAPVPQQGGGIQIIDETQSTINRCKREEEVVEVTKPFWRRARDFVVRQVTGKKTPAKACSVTAKPATKAPAKAPPKTAAKPATKAAAKKPATKAAVKKPATKKTAAKKKPRSL
ncbi:hypothetical protein Moror_16226 [Moniliophthora roreri MCA 2997]|uniref:Uncharacterized protein n=1 Tax=Moniliophthora roreri (strain MCA 2997) TaxID=1381753 RepID=V2WRA6_MONRO|nr:hypothetical protein Moror_16226 [Moniliophthora roreri MCA 2997]